jgi:uncharacterized protein (TIGR00725 family)
VETLIAVIGAGQCTPREAGVAEEVGRELARKGAVLVCGGLGGVMESACRGALKEGGRTIGILPGNSAEEANPFVQFPLVTGMGHARNVIVVKSARAVIAVGGSYGTLSEIAHALQNRVPVVGLSTWELARNGREDTSVVPASTPQEAVEKALELARRPVEHH